MRNGKSMLMYLPLVVLCFGVGIAIWAGCDSNQSPTSPTQETAMEKQNVNNDNPETPFTGIRVDGTEKDALHPVEVHTYEVWYNGMKIKGPSPKGNYWTSGDAEFALRQVKNGLK